MVKMSLYLITYHIIKMYGGVGVHPNKFLTSVLDGGMEVGGQLFTLATGKAQPSYWTGCWMGSRVNLDAKEKRTLSCSCQELNSD
jgi:hypothetical protein